MNAVKETNPDFWDENAPQTIFILKGNNKSLVGAEQFLKNREWNIFSTTDVKKGLLHIIQNTPPIVMLSSDHPHPKVRILAKVLRQVYPVHIIGFSENATTYSSRLLENMDAEQALYAPVSGPQIMRTVTMIIREYNKKATTKEAGHRTIQGGAGPEAGPDYVTVKGESVKGGGIGVMSAEAKAALARMLGGEESAAGSLVGNSGTDVGEDLSSVIRSASGGVGIPDLKSEAGVNLSRDLSANFDHIDEGDLRGNLEPSSDEGPLLKSNAAHSAEHSLKNQGSGEGGGETDPSSYTQRGKSAGAAWVPDKPEEIHIKRGVERYGSSSDTVIAKGAAHAIEIQKIEGRVDGPREVVQKSSNVACIIIESPRFSGYLVAALGADRKMDTSFTELIGKRLFEFLKTHGEQVNEKETLDLKLQEVEFENWSLEEAEFLKKSVHNGSEIAMAFFPTKETQVKLADSKLESMAKISIDDLRPDIPVEFDLYLHLEANDKYLLHTQRGRPFLAEQKERLNQRGVKEMHLRKDAIRDVKKYRAQNYLNEKIEAYKNKKNNPAAQEGT